MASSAFYTLTVGGRRTTINLIYMTQEQTEAQSSVFTNTFRQRRVCGVLFACSRVHSSDPVRTLDWSATTASVRRLHPHFGHATFPTLLDMIIHFQISLLTLAVRTGTWNRIEPFGDHAFRQVFLASGLGSTQRRTRFVAASTLQRGACARALPSRTSSTSIQSPGFEARTHPRAVPPLDR